MAKISDNKIRGIRASIPSQVIIGRVDKGTGKAQLLDGTALRRILGPGYVKAIATTVQTLTQNHIFVGNALNVATDVAMSGDATIVASGALTIANDAITYAKMQNVSAASKLLGRGSAGGAGDVEEITLGTNLTMTGTTLNATTGGGGGVDISPFSDNSITKPVASAFTIADDTTVGHGTGSKIDLTTRGVEFTHTLGANATSQSLFFEAAVSNTLGTMIAYISPNFVGTNGNHTYFYGIGVRDNTGKIDSFGLVFDSGVGNTVWFHATFATISTAPTLSSLISSGHVACGRPIWLKLQKVATNFEFSVSLNGETYTNIATVSAKGFVGATLNDVGIILYNAIPTGTKVLNLDCFSFTRT